MYKPTKVGNTTEVLDFINNNDVYNSALINNLKDYPITPEDYKTQFADRRTDIVANRLGFSESLLWIYNKLYKGEKRKVLHYFDSITLDKIQLRSMK